MDSELAFASKRKDTGTLVSGSWKFGPTVQPPTRKAAIRPVRRRGSRMGMGWCGCIGRGRLLLPGNLLDQIVEHRDQEDGDEAGEDHAADDHEAHDLPRQGA